MPTIDQYSVAVVPIETYFRATPLSVATCFFWRGGEEFYLITNWHVVSGRDAVTGKHLSSTAAEPDRLRVWWNVKNALGQKTGAEHSLRSGDGNPLWLVHPQYKNMVDVVALPIAVPDFAEAYAINGMPSKSLQLSVGGDVFVLGYPFGIGPSGLPIWKRGSFASEPDVIDKDRPVILVDTASRPGMSGSPVIRRSWNTHALEDGKLEMGIGDATRLVGVYSGRLATTDANDPQLGLTWPIKFVEEVIKGHTRDT